MSGGWGGQQGGWGAANQQSTGGGWAPQQAAAPATGGWAAQQAEIPAWAGYAVAATAPAPAPAPRAVGCAGGQTPATMVVSGCTNPTVALLIKGAYQKSDTNHGKPVFMKPASTAGGVDALLYFWDERDGPAFGGWWLGPKVGGDQVWAYNKNKASPLPPLTAWQVPWDGPVDEQLRVASASPAPAVPNFAGKGAAPAGKGPAAGKGALLGKGAAGAFLAGPAAGGWKGVKAPTGPDLAAQARQHEKEQEMAKRQEELRRKRGEEQSKRAEQAAALVVRKSIQKLRSATPETFDDLQGELERVQTEQLEKMGSQAEKVLQDATKALEAAQASVEKVAEERNAEARKKMEAEAKRKADDVRIEALAKQATEEVASVEEGLKEVENTAMPMEEIGDGPPDTVLGIVEKTEKAIIENRAALLKTSTSLTEKLGELGNSEVATAKRKEFPALRGRLADCKRKLEKLGGQAKSAKEKAVRKSTALKRENKEKEAFGKYDAGKGFVDRKGVAKFSTQELKFKVSDEVLDKIMRVLARGDTKGVERGSFHRMRAMVGVAKYESKAREQRAVEAEKERVAKEEEDARQKVIEEKKAELKKVIDGIKEIEKAAEQAAKQADEAGKGLQPQALKELSSKALGEVCAKVDADAAAAVEVLKTFGARIAEAEEEVDAGEEFKNFQKREVSKLRQSEKRFQMRIDRVSASAKSSREQMKKKTFVEAEQLRTKVAESIRERMTSKNASGDEMFKEAGGGSFGLNCGAFASFVKALDGIEIEASQAETLFAHLVLEGKTTLGKEEFLEVIRVFYKCVKPTVITEELSIKSKTSRRLESAEVVEVLEGPKKEVDVDLQRIRCRAVRDDVIGWVTVAGNQGSKFMEPGGSSYTVVKETSITDGPLIAESKTVRALKKGELLEVIEFGKKDIKADAERIKARARSDGQSGWVTVKNDKTTFLEPS